MNYMIHAVPERTQYVFDYLVPSMLKQGIKNYEIFLYTDVCHEGNLKSTLKSFELLEQDGYTVHLQDDVIISSDFAEKTEYRNDMVICGFASCYDKGPADVVTPEDMWYSFPCIGIPNRYAHEFVRWVEENEDESDLIKIANNMYDDYLFKSFMQQCHPRDYVVNLAPNLVNNIDYLIGGTTLVKREEKIESLYWYEPELIEQLKKDLS